MLKKSSKAEPGDLSTPEEEIKDPFVLEFLGLKDEYSESDLEEARTASAHKPYPFHRASCRTEGQVVKAVTTNNVHNSARIKNSAPILPARTLKLTIVNRTQVEGEKIGSEEIYFDRQTLFEQLGLKAN
jgi:hypothetical protein